MDQTLNCHNFFQVLNALRPTVHIVLITEITSESYVFVGYPQMCLNLNKSVYLKG